MLISELLIELSKKKDEYGDVEVKALQLDMYNGGFSNIVRISHKEAYRYTTLFDNTIGKKPFIIIEIANGE